MLLSLFDKKVDMQQSSGTAMARAMAIACTIVEAVVVAAAVYHMWLGNAIAATIFAVVALLGLFWCAAMWGGDLDRRKDPVPVPPHELHQLVEADYTSLISQVRASSLVITLRTVEPYVTIEAINNGFAADWLVQGESMFEAYVKAWLQASGEGDTNELRN